MRWPGALFLFALPSDAFLIFATTELYSPNFITLENADAACTSAIADQNTINIPIGGAACMAWMSNVTVTARSRSYGEFPVYTTSGNPGGVNWEANSMADAAVGASIAIRTTGDGALSSNGPYTWTGSTRYGLSGGNTCNNWHSYGSNYNGDVGYKGTDWAGQYLARQCNTRHHLLCVQVGYPSTGAGGIIVFQTNNWYSGAIGGLSGADSQCQAQAGTWRFLVNKTFRALLATSKSNLASRALPNRPLLSLSGVVLYPSLANALLQQRLNADTIVTGFASSQDAYWIGGSNYACQDWTSKSNTSQGTYGQTVGATTSNPSWTNQGQAACNIQKPFLCIESVSACLYYPCDANCQEQPDAYGRVCSCPAGTIGSGEPGQCIAIKQTGVTLLSGTTWLDATTIGVTSTSGGEQFQVQLAIVGTHNNPNGPNYNITLNSMAFTSSTGGATCTFTRSTYTLPSSNTATISATCVMKVGGGGHSLSASLPWCVNFPGAAIYCSVFAPGIYVSFPQPKITSNTIRRSASDKIGSSVFYAQNAGDSVSFNGVDFICNNFMQVYLGTPSNLKMYGCQVSTVDCTPSTMVCVPDSQGVGGFFIFTVIAAGQNSTGSDQFYYPVLPRITSVRGCPGGYSLGTSQCPTVGGVLLYINGSNFYGNVSVLIDMKPCTFPTSTPDGTLVTCICPQGTGVERSIIVTVGGTLSAAMPLVSYADPLITELQVSPTDCDLEDALKLTNCNRYGGGILTIIGSNFGASNATVRIGTVKCGADGDPSGDHTTLKCILPQGNFVNQPVSVSALNGGTTSQGSISYLPCPVGQEQDPSNITECTLCSPGFANDVVGQNCTPCTPGKYTYLPGKITCENCASGYYEPESNSTQCKPCSEGTYAMPSGVLCLPCDIGTYAEPASSICQPCPVGTYQDSPGSSECLPCSNGTFSSTQGQQSCIACELGTFGLGTSCDQCSIGFFQNTSGQTACLPCEPGYIAPTAGHFLCLACKAGTFLNTSAGSECIPCGPGTYQSSTEATKCEECAAGKYSTRGLALCESCERGTYSASNGSRSCNPCEPDHYQLYPGQSDCVPCSAGEQGRTTTSCSSCVGNTISQAGQPCIGCLFGFSNPGHTKCQCPLKSYLNVNSETCITCSEGLVCDSDGLTFRETKTQPGWWRANITTSLYKCPNADNCIGNDHCDTGRTGILCSICIKGYSSAYFGGSCRACPSRGRAMLASAGILIGIALALALIFAFVLHHSKPLERACITHHPNVSSPTGTALGMGAGSNNNSAVGSAFEAAGMATGVASAFAAMGNQPQSNILRQTNIAGETGVVHIPEKPSNLVSQFKILIGFIQVLLATVRQGDLTWPRAFSKLLSDLSFINLDFIPWQSLSCVADVNGLRQAEVVCALPFFSLLVAIPLFVVLWVLDKMDYSDSNKQRLRRKIVGLKSIRIFLFTCFLFYPHVSSVIVGVYNCREVDGVMYMRTDSTVLCNSAAWASTAYPLLVGVAIYPIGVPLLFLCLIWRNRRNLEEPTTLLAYGALYEPYCGSMWYFEAIDMVYKLFMTSLIPLAKDSYQLPIGLGGVGFYLMVMLVTDPYKRTSDHTLHSFLLADLVVLHVFGYALQTSDTALTPFADNLLSVFLIALFVCMVIFFVIMVVKSAKSSVYTWVRQKKARQLAESKRRGSTSQSHSHSSASHQVAEHAQPDPSSALSVDTK